MLAVLEELLSTRSLQRVSSAVARDTLSVTSPMDSRNWSQLSSSSFDSFSICRMS